MDTPLHQLLPEAELLLLPEPHHRLPRRPPPQVFPLWITALVQVVAQRVLVVPQAVVVQG